MPAKKTATKKSASLKTLPKASFKTMAGIRMSPAERALIDQAAKKVRRSRTDFVMLYALQAAEKVLENPAV